MEKIAKIAGAAILLLFFAMIVFSYVSSPPIDNVLALDKFIQVTKQYVDRKPIKPNEIEVIDENHKYVKVWAEYLKSISDIERAADTKRRLAKISIQAQNFNNGEDGANRAYNRIEEFNESIAQTNEDFYEAINILVDKSNKTDKEKTFFKVGAIAEEAKTEADYFDQLSSYRVVVAQYLRAIVDFIASREGFYNVEGNRIVFDSEQDQDYYEKLYLEMQKYNNEIDQLSNEHRNTMRGELNKIVS